MPGMCVLKFLTIWICLALASASPAAAHPGAGVVADSTGQVFVVDAEHNKVWVIDGDRSYRVVGHVHAHLLGLGPDGTVYGNHTEWDEERGEWQGSLWKLGVEGIEVVAGPSKDAFSAQFTPIFDLDGTQYGWRGDLNVQTSSVIEQWHAKSGLEALAGGAWGQRDGIGSSAQFSKVGALSVDELGAIMLTDGNCVRRIDKSEYVSTLACHALLETPWYHISKGESSHLTSISVAPGGVFVANHATGNVLYVDKGGVVTRWLEKEGPWPALGVFYSDGTLYALEQGKGGLRVRLSREKGQAVVLVQIPAE